MTTDPLALLTTDDLATLDYALRYVQRDLDGTLDMHDSLRISTVDLAGLRGRVLHARSELDANPSPRFVLTIDCGNAAFAADLDEYDQGVDDLDARRYEVARILRRVADHLVGDPQAANDGAGAPVRDVNGTTVGAWQVTP